MGEFVNDFTVKLPCKAAVKSFGSRSSMGTLFVSYCMCIVCVCTVHICVFMCMYVCVYMYVYIWCEHTCVTGRNVGICKEMLIELISHYGVFYAGTYACRMFEFILIWYRQDIKL